MSSSVPDHDLTAAIAALFAKLGPGIAGALISLRFVPVGTSWASRFSLCWEALLPRSISPLRSRNGWASRIAGSRPGSVFWWDRWPLSCSGEVTQAVHDAQIGSAARDWLRKKAGL
jgi:hypothetical protein